MPKHSDVSETAAMAQVPTNFPSFPIITPNTPPVEATPPEPAPEPDIEEPVVEPTPEPVVEEEPVDEPIVEEPVVEPAPTPEPEADPIPEPPVETEPPVEEPVVKPKPQPPVKEHPVHKGDKPIESLPVGSAEERAVTYVSQIEDEEVRALLLGALADKRVFSQDEDLRYRMQVADSIREMMRYIRTNVPASATFKTFMEGVNSYMVMVETQGIPSMWSEESASAPLDEIQARKAAMAIERAIENLDMHKDGEEPKVALKKYAQKVREGKIK